MPESAPAAVVVTHQSKHTMSNNSVVKTFEMTHDFFECVCVFTEIDAPSWLTGGDSVLNSTLDNRWFWIEHVLSLNVGESACSDFRTIKRLA